MPARMRNNDPNCVMTPLIQQGDASSATAADGGRGHRLAAGQRAGRSRHLHDRQGLPAERGPRARPQGHRHSTCSSPTPKNREQLSDVKHELIDLPIEEGNESFRMSNLGNIKLRLAHAYQTDYEEDKDGEHFDHLYRMVDKGDGYMEEVHALRDKYRRRSWWC
jgi:hypothetical protein